MRENWKGSRKPQATQIGRRKKGNFLAKRKRRLGPAEILFPENKIQNRIEVGCSMRVYLGERKKKRRIVAIGLTFIWRNSLYFIAFTGNLKNSLGFWVPLQGKSPPCIVGLMVWCSESHPWGWKTRRYRNQSQGLMCQVGISPLEPAPQP